MCDSLRIEEAAAAWIARKDREDWGEADEAALTEWIQASLARRIAYLRLNAVWQQTLRLKELVRNPRGKLARSKPLSTEKVVAAAGSPSSTLITKDP